jgi:hypothetical protein
MRKLHKVTPEVYRWLVDESKKLPKLQRTLNGKPIYPSKTRYVGSFYDINESAKIKNTIERIKEPLLVNHEVELINRYKSGGRKEAELYINSVNQFYEAANKIKESIPETNKDEVSVGSEEAEPTGQNHN